MQGQQLGPYKILRQIGAGGMGAVYEALQVTIERRVAIKILHPQFARDSGVMQRFANEARAVNLIDHPALVQISDFGRLDDGTAYIVMELLRGQTLARRAEENAGKLPAAITMRVCAQVAAALQAAHHKGVIHRDLKPENVMLVPDELAPAQERIKILDFGIAKFAEAAQREQVQTRTGTLLGTPRYMSPEQCRGADRVTDRADVYSLGVMLFELLSGSPPFIGQSAFDVLAKHIYEPAPSLDSLCPDLPGDLCTLVASLLAKEGALRPSMAQVRATLDQLALAPPGSDAEPAASCGLGRDPLEGPQVVTPSMHWAKGEQVRRSGQQRLAIATSMLAGCVLLGAVIAVPHALRPAQPPASSQAQASAPVPPPVPKPPPAPASPPQDTASPIVRPAEADSQTSSRAPVSPVRVLTPPAVTPRPGQPAAPRRERQAHPSRSGKPSREIIPYGLDND